MKAELEIHLTRIVALATEIEESPFTLEATLERLTELHEQAEKALELIRAARR